jgi:hypothetical protein
MFYTRFHVPVDIALLINYTRLKAKIISAQQLPCYFTLYENITSRKVAYFSNTYYNTSLSGPISGASGVPTSQFWVSAIVENKKLQHLGMLPLYAIHMKFC